MGVVDLGGADAVCNAPGNDKIVDAPARVLFPRVEAVAPPAVLHLVRVHHPEAVRKTCRQQLGHFGALLIGKACAHAVGLGVFDIHLGVRHVQIAAQDHRLFCVQCQQVRPEGVLPLHAVVQPLQPVLTVGGVAVYQIKAGVFQRQHPSLVVVLFQPDAGGHCQRCRFAPAGCAGIALFLGRVGVFGVALRRKICLSRLHLGLLHREDVRVQRGKALGKAVGQAGAQAVHVPADQFHAFLLIVMPDILFSMRRCGSAAQSRSRGRSSR